LKNIYLKEIKNIKAANTFSRTYNAIICKGFVLESTVSLSYIALSLPHKDLKIWKSKQPIT